MKKLQFLTFLSATTLVFFSGCNKKTQPQPVPGTDPVDTAFVKLKEYTVSNLPAPYYHFTYNDEGYATNIEYASGMLKYVLQYENKRLKKMISTTDGETRVYEYSNGRVSLINGFETATGKKISHNDITYDQHGRLAKISWFVHNDNAPAGILDKVSELHYNTDGNLNNFTHTYTDRNGQLAYSTLYTFDDYDNKTNVESFSLFKDFFEHLVYLPGITIQKNNPRKSRISGIQNEYEINYAYTYHPNSLPQIKTTTIKQIRGDNPGLVTTGNTVFSYY